MRVKLSTVGLLLQRVALCLHLCDGVTLFFGQFQLFFTQSGYNGLVDTLPVVHVLTSAPLTLESLLALLHSHRVVEIPLAVAHAARCCCGLGLRLIAEYHAGVALQGLLCVGFCQCVSLFFLFLLQCFNDTVDGGIAVFLVHLG